MIWTPLRNIAAHRTLEICSTAAFLLVDDCRGVLWSRGADSFLSCLRQTTQQPERQRTVFLKRKGSWKQHTCCTMSTSSCCAHHVQLLLLSTSNVFFVFAAGLSTAPNTKSETIWLKRSGELTLFFSYFEPYSVSNSFQLHQKSTSTKASQGLLSQ